MSWKEYSVKTKLRVCHYPQIPCEPFIVNVADEREAWLIYTTLADQHLWLYNNNIIPDYSNAIIVQMWDADEEEWFDYESADVLYDWNEFMDEFGGELKGVL